MKHRKVFMRLAYYFSIFPLVSTTFLQREVNALRSIGINPVCIANQKPDPGNVHPNDRKLLGETFYLKHAGSLRTISANLKQFVKSPGKYLNCIRYALQLDDDFPGMRIRNLARVAGAAVLAQFLSEKKITHIHVHFAFGAAGIAILLKRMSEITYSISIHGSDVLLPQPFLEEKLKNAEFVISNCFYHVENLKKKFESLRHQKFKVVRLGLDLEQGDWTGTEKEVGFETLNILNVARLEPVKDHETLIRACSRLKKNKIPFHLKIIGDGPVKETITALIRQLDLADSVELLGRRYEKEVAEWMNWCHVFVLSSKSEGTPMTIIEAMAKSRAVIAPHITALPEMVEHGKTGYLFEKENDESLSDILAELAENSERITEMGEEGRKKAEQLFDIRKNILKLREVFKQKIEKQQTGR